MQDVKIFFNRLSMRCSANRTQIYYEELCSTLLNPFIQNITISDMYCTSKSWIHLDIYSPYKVD